MGRTLRLALITAIVLNGRGGPCAAAEAAAEAAPQAAATGPDHVPGAPEAPAAEAEAPPPALVVQSAFYVPYEKLKDVFEKEGRGIFLPYEEFLKLWREAQPKPPAPPPEEAPAPAVIRGGHYLGALHGDVAKFTVVFDIEALRKGWCELALPLKNVALERADLSDSRAVFAAQGEAYAVFLPGPGAYKATLAFVVRVAQEPGKKTFSFGIVPAAISRLELTIPEEGARVEVRPALAVAETSAGGGATKVLAFLGNASELAVSVMPPAGKVAEGAAVVLASQAIRAYLGERILRIATDVEYQVVRGEVGTLKLKAPENTRLLSVKGDNIREWSQEGDTLLVTLHTALKEAARGAGAYRLALTFERILAETPASLAVPFPRVEDVIREAGWVVFSHDNGLDVRVAATTGLSQLDKEEVPEALRGGPGVGFRYLAQPLALGVAVEKITPSIRSTTTSVVSLGREEDVWTGWVDYDIAKAGVFRLLLKVPARWNIVQIGAENAVEDAQASEERDGLKTIAVNLKSKALGAFKLPFKFTAQGSAAAGAVTLAAPVVADSGQDRGIFGVSAPKAFNVSTVERRAMTSADVDALFKSGIMNQLGPEAGLPLTYGYREAGPAVTVRLEAKQTEIDVLAQHLIEIRDGGIAVTHYLDFEVLYAAVDRLTFSAPATLDNLLKVEAGAKKELRRLSSDQGRSLWELTLQAPVLGAVPVTITHETDLKALQTGRPFAYEVQFIEARDARAHNGFVAIRKEGTLEIADQPRNMEAIDASDLPDKLRQGRIYRAFRYFAPDPGLDIQLTRYEYETLATTVVSLLRMRSVLSEQLRLKTEAVLMVQNAERQYLALKFGRGADILSLSVDGKAQKPRLRKEDPDTRLVQIPASAGSGGTFPVVVVYEEPLGEGAMGLLGSVSFASPEILENIPVGKLEVELYLPPDFVYLGWGGTLRPGWRGAPRLWRRFEDLLKAVVEADAGAAAQAPRAPAGDVAIPLRGARHEFESLAPRGTLRCFYAGRTLFSAADFALFLAAAAVGGVLAARKRASKTALLCVLVLAPLALTWFVEGPAVELCASLLAGGVVGIGVAWIAGAVRAARARRREAVADLAVAAAPEADPFLEDLPLDPPPSFEGPADDAERNRP